MLSSITVRIDLESQMNWENMRTVDRIPSTKYGCVQAEKNVKEKMKKESRLTLDSSTI